MNNKLSSVLKLMQFIGTVEGGASVTQVALNYLRAKGQWHEAQQCLLFGS